MLLSVETISNILKALGFTHIKSTERGWVNTHCPFAKELHEKGTDNSISFGVSVTGWYYCFTCHSHGNLKDLLFRLGKSELVKEFDLHKIQFKKGLDRTKKQNEIEEKYKNVFPKSLLKLYEDSENIARDYLWSRGVRKYIQENNICYDKYNDTVLIPVYDNNIIVGFVGRNLNNKMRYDLDNFPRGKYLYRPVASKKIKSNKIIVVEGTIDTLKTLCAVDDLDVEVGGLLGTSITKFHLTKLKMYDIIYLFLDGDRSGVEATEKLYKELHGRVKLKFMKIPSNKNDPGDLSIKKIRHIYLREAVNLF